MEWLIKESGFDKGKIELNGNKFLIGNGYMGYRGTMEEFSKEQLVACNLSDLYDKVGDKWREPVNAPNGLFTRLYCNGELLSVLSSDIDHHEQELNIRNSTHRRYTKFINSSGIKVEVRAERFVSLYNLHLICMKYSFKASESCDVVIETGIDGQVWDINGPHLINLETYQREDNCIFHAITNENKNSLAVAERIEVSFGNEVYNSNSYNSFREISSNIEVDKEYTFIKYVSVFKDRDEVEDCVSAAIKSNISAVNLGYDKLFEMNKELWDQRWNDIDVEIEGDDYSQLALRYSIYHLMIIAPTHTDKTSIPARGLSGQVYKGAIFWDTEIFMLPFFLNTKPEIAKNLIKYRCNTLDGARRKAADYGYRGAFYAWESQDTGDDACTYFNVTDVFTGRPMRTYFRDKQVHISADVAYAIWQYYLATGDESILVEGGAETIIECARFFYSYAYFNMDKNRYEVLDVTGPDEYHERVNNNAYTSIMVKYTLEAALSAIKLLKNKYEEEYISLNLAIKFEREVDNFKDMLEKLYIPSPDKETNIIEQFDGYERLENISLEKLKERIIDPNEYLGGGNGLATTTKILKQADVVLVLNLFKDRYSEEVKRSNWEYYEPQTEHGSSLSACVYALLAADLDKVDWAYKYFLKTATIDLTGDSKQYVGTLYIGGTHPASNGGAWMTAVLGFGGVKASEGQITMSPKLPESWTSLKFRVVHYGQKYSVSITKNQITIKADNINQKSNEFIISGKKLICNPGQIIEIGY
ncbi:glycoside hydrolase family 65 protein [Clostridium fungisolvens]|uniref:Nigerose phosphorylase n=1 Tax=Clostridium fungisolvens TaxID=1604897 RepID=A0A6V8SPB4_9CLOT|nr:glycoside hydrolase family 65 protein [Clostridium fungisolvens]GFP78455.1 Nigerose phosphorylase [Clostridium fungisolvens]